MEFRTAPGKMGSVRPRSECLAGVFCHCFSEYLFAGAVEGGTRVASANG
jgi:hypothetical protein